MGLTGMRGRPPKPGSPKYAAWVARKKAAEAEAKNGSKVKLVQQANGIVNVIPEIDINETDEEIIKRIAERFDVMYKCAKGATGGSIRSLIVSGAGGVGKTHTIERILEHAKEHKNIQFETVHGVLSPINLYMLLYRNRTKNCVVLLDDADSIFKDESALSIMKVALDSSPVRKISWMAESHALKENDIPKEYLYEGTMIFITNLNFQGIVDSGRGSMIPHMQALMTRALYLDLKLHTQRELLVWIDYMVRKHGILIADGLTKHQQEDVLSFMKDNQDKLRNLSIRTALKLGAMVKMEGDDWKKMARNTECR
jgi:hypothetical protein